MTLIEALTFMKMINETDDYECFFSNGKLIVQTKALYITYYNY